MNERKPVLVSKNDRFAEVAFLNGIGFRLHTDGNMLNTTKRNGQKIGQGKIVQYDKARNLFYSNKNPTMVYASGCCFVFLDNSNMTLSFHLPPNIAPELVEKKGDAAT